MKRKSLRLYLIFIGFLLLILSLPTSYVENTRSLMIQWVAPCWQKVFIAKASVISFLQIPVSNTKTVKNADSLEIEKLRLENYALKHQLDQMKQWIFHEENLERKWMHWKELSQSAIDDPFWREFFKRRETALSDLLNLQYQAILGEVIFREPNAWNSCVWINLGEKNNQILGKTIIAKNSPVVFGTFLIGVVEFVDKDHSRIRLITDPRLIPSVRAIRGFEANQNIAEQIDALTAELRPRLDLFTDRAESENLLQRLISLKNNLQPTVSTYYLAKGELRGATAPSFRSCNNILKGIGFNYDLKDLEGPARNLRTGETLDSSFRLGSKALLQIGDLLVTTGLDGIFPADLPVATVTKIFPLKEGGSSYDLEATLCVSNLDKLKYVFVIPPISLEIDEEQRQ